MSEILDRARRDDFRVNVFEAYDEPWKRRWEGTVGGYWGLLDGTERKLKYPAGADVSNHPFWKLQMVCGMILCTCVFAAAWLTRRGRPSPSLLAPWVAIAISATTGGILFGIAAEKMILESYGIGGWLLQGLLPAAGMVASLLSANALISGRALPSFWDVLAPPEGRSQWFMTKMLGTTLIVTTLIGAEIALSLVFDARWRDFPFAALTMAVVPFCTVAFLNPPQSGTRPLAEAVFAGLFAAASLYIIFNEGPRNWQSLWTCAAYLVLGITLWRPRTVAVAETALIAATAVLGEVGPAPHPRGQAIQVTGPARQVARR
jgi:hypothetical protein